MFEPPGPRPLKVGDFDKAIMEWRRLSGFTVALAGLTSNPQVEGTGRRHDLLFV